MVLYGGLWANTYAPYLALGAAGMAVLAVRLVRMKWVREKLWRLAFRLPVVGQWLTNVEIARWSSVMAGLLQNRVELTEALALAGKTVRAPQWEGRFQQVRDSVEGGDRLSRALYHSGVLSPTSYNLIFSGEKSGNLPEMFGAVSRLADDSAQTRMKRVLTLIEPLAILLIGSVVGVIILGVVLAITSANQVGI
jgi:general secretion pathway protein F